jgi:hypothetical protein
VNQPVDASIRRLEGSVVSVAALARPNPFGPAFQ